MAGRGLERTSGLRFLPRSGRFLRRRRFLSSPWENRVGKKKRRRCNSPVLVTAAGSHEKM
jgi:hypothetical protein